MSQKPLNNPSDIHIFPVRLTSNANNHSWLNDDSSISKNAFPCTLIYSMHNNDCWSYLLLLDDFILSILADDGFSFECKNVLEFQSLDALISLLWKIYSNRMEKWSESIIWIWWKKKRPFDDNDGIWNIQYSISILKCVCLCAIFQ